MGFDTGRPTSADPSDVSTRDDFGNFMAAVLDDYTSAGKDEWENPTVERLLEALSAFAHAHAVMGGDQEAPSWKLFAEMIVAATGYE